MDTGAWVALAATQDPFHLRARELWERLRRDSARVVSSTPVVIETFTFLDRNGSRALAQAWAKSLSELRELRLLGCSAVELGQAWQFLEDRRLHRLSLVDATSFVLMKGHGIRRAFTFDHHFAVAGFLTVG